MDMLKRLRRPRQRRVELRLGEHQHKCHGCGHVFTHGNENYGDVKAHMCPECGAGPWWNQYDQG